MRTETRDLALYVAMCLTLALIARGRDEPNQTPERKPAQGLLWRVDSETATVYLLGVIHVGDDNLYPLSPTIEFAFARAKVLVQEMKTDEESQQRLHKMISEVGTYPPQESLEQHLSPDVRASYEDYIKRSHTDPNSLKRFRPWVVAWMISMNEARRLGYSYDRGVSVYLRRQADSKDKKDLVGLETPEDCADLFKVLPHETQESYLRMVLAQAGTFPQTMERMIDIWRRGDWGAAEKIFVESYGGSGTVPFCASERNQRMTARIEEYLKTDRTYFVTVGAAHLVGEGGIVQRLRRRGHRVNWLGPREYAMSLAQDDGRLEAGPLTLDLHISRTAPLFHVVDQIARWSEFCYRQYVPCLQGLEGGIGKEDQDLLAQHCALGSEGDCLGGELPSRPPDGADRSDGGAAIRMMCPDSGAPLPEPDRSRRGRPPCLPV